MNTGEADNSLDQSTAGPSTENYCSHVPVLVQNANDHYLRKKVYLELEIERLIREHANIDEIIAEKLKSINDKQKEGAELDRQIYNAKEMKKQTMARFKTTGDIIDVLKDETDKLQAHAKRVEARRLEITKNVVEFRERRNKNEEAKKRIAELEREVRELIEMPEPKLDENLVKKNEELKKRLRLKRESLEMKRMKKCQIAEKKEQKINLLTMITKRQEENQQKLEDVANKKADLKKSTEEMEAKWRGLDEKIKQKIIKKDKLRQELIESIKRSEEEELKIEKLKGSISEKEMELATIKKKCEVQRAYVGTEKEKIQKDYSIEKGKLLKIDEAIETQLAGKKQNLNILKEKTEELTNLRTKKEELTTVLYEKKITLLNRQHENKEQQNNSLLEKFRYEQEEVKQLRIRNEELNKKRKELQSKLEELPQEFADKREKLELKHKETIDGLIKKTQFNMASMEFTQNRLDNAEKQVKNLKKEIQDREASIEWDEMGIDRRQIGLTHLKENIKKEQLSYEKLLKQLKSQTAQHFEAFEPEEPSTSQGNSVSKAFQDSEPMEIAESWDKEGQQSSGRRSPGILKKATIQRSKSPQTPTKKVTFKGFSSAESSSQDDGGVGESTLDDVLKTWIPSLKEATKKPPMDF